MPRRTLVPGSDWADRLAGLRPFDSFDQSNGLDAPPVAEEHYREAAHTVAPERLNGISRHFH